MHLPQLEDLGDLSGRRVLVRCDFNVPLSDGVITDDMRIRAALPTLRYLIGAGAAVTACSHLGRPGGRPDPAFAMDPVRERLADLVPGGALLDDLRFDPGGAVARPGCGARRPAPLGGPGVQRGAPGGIEVHVCLPGLVRLAGG